MSTYPGTESISVNEAITKGRQMLLLPRILLVAGLFFFLFVLALIFIAVTQGPPENVKVWAIMGGVAVAVGLLFFWLPYWFWSKRTTQWKLWAFGHVDNVHELKIMATEANLCPVYGSVMDKLQLQTASERQRWRDLQDRFTVPEIFRDDPDVPAVSEIRYSKFHMVVNFLLGAALVVTGIAILFLAFKNDSPTSLKLVGALLTIAPLYMMFRSIERIFTTRPVIIMSNTALVTQLTGPLHWDLVHDQQVRRINRGRNTIRYLLIFKHPGGMAEIDVTELAISKAELERLMRVYKHRYAAGIR
ncbi:hypothetical protein LLH06_07495 [Mucilaginibacter daejeonensis]|uniref:hypothetical protein n=1 Tax=Mucilaginibacter daejeonensis TaxID=398049 RepID=UPI001D177246|nr:hypothetical protein [Mucilaginibacter daejeonensis]UEG54806.1 hypothetical protein LLH06_07495 [Mucilaginibacter daejeonensis]